MFHRSITRGAVVAAAFVGVLSLSASAFAQRSVHTRNGDSANKIAAGVMDIGIDSLWILSYAENEGSSTSRLALQSGITVRRFIKDNVAVGGRLAGIYNSLGEDTSERGATGMAVANYYMRLGSGMFFAPGIGVGGLYGVREDTSAGGGTVMQSTLTGGTFSISLPMAFYAWQTFNVRAGFEMSFTAGVATPDQGDSESYTTVDGGFNVGFGYYF